MHRHPIFIALRNWHCESRISFWEKNSPNLKNSQYLFHHVPPIQMQLHDQFSQTNFIDLNNFGDSNKFRTRGVRNNRNNRGRINTCRWIDNEGRKAGKRSEKTGELKIRRSEQTAIKTFMLHVACVVRWWRGGKSFHWTRWKLLICAVISIWYQRYGEERKGRKKKKKKGDNPWGRQQPVCLAVLNEQLHGSDANDRESRCILNEVSPAYMRSNAIRPTN